MTKAPHSSGDDASASHTSSLVLFDTHAHLDQSEFDADRDAVIARAQAAGVRQILCPGVSLETSQAVVQLAEQRNLWAAVGIHPNSTADAGPHDWDRVVALVDHPRVVALGETGLDRYWDHAPLALQQEYLDRHLRLGQQRDMPVLLHCREASAELLAALREAAARGPLRGVVHAFSGNAALAAELLSLGLHLSFAGNVTYSNKKYDSLRTAAQTVPDDRLLVETDSPYLVPQLFRGKHRRNEPANVAHTAAFLAELRGVTADRIARQTTENALQLFRIPKAVTTSSPSDAHANPGFSEPP